jgi:cellulose synthase/poly-beta-1,6-N-acetylglucosamine synthase-like glycosyltransferase
MLIVDSLFVLLAGYLLVVTAYLAVVTGAGLSFSPQPGAAHPRMLVVVPAHDEEAGIAGCLESLSASRYPAERLRIVVVADNCTDSTADRARDAGVEVRVRDDPKSRGKGRALSWFLESGGGLLDWARAVAVVDADTRVDPDFLAQAAHTLETGETPVVQGHYGVLDPCADRRRALTAAALAVFHHLRPMGRVKLGGSAGLKGNGMVFDAAFLRSRGWEAHGLAEDLEMSLLLARDGIRVMYDPLARVRGEAAASDAGARVQRLRWEGGRMRALALAPGLAAGLPDPGGLVRLESLLDLATPPLGWLLLFQIGLALYWPPAWLLAAVTLAHVVVGLLAARAERCVWKSLVLAPAYLVWKLRLVAGLASLALSVNPQWLRTPRHISHRDGSPRDRDRKDRDG